ncbi:MAG TPA: TipAS antibiotic-recognition domain-containing protein, partial [Blastocatellia bacterium]|nr:TipAS antibiotic-recognition domain-containing protein [Blastocatellia bacterium]
EALQFQRQVLEEKRRRLDQAISAIQRAEKAMQPGKPVDSSALKAIIEVIKMQNDVDFMQKYFSERAWAKRKERRAEGGLESTSKLWMDLFADIEDAFGDDPAGERAQALTLRWMKLWTAATDGDPELEAGWIRAWADRQNWPRPIRQKISQLNIEKVAEFIAKALTVYRKKYYSASAWDKTMKRTPEQRQRDSRAWHELVVEVGAALKEDPGSEKAQALATRWMELAEISTGGDAAIKAGARNAWADYQNWPAVQRQLLTRLKIEEVADFIGKALSMRAGTATEVSAQLKKKH